MSGLLMAWCNEGLMLSRPVRSERDFSNGYLFGEVLAKFNQQADFDRFIDDNKSNSQVNNYCRLEPTLRRMRIKFDSKIAFALMKGQSGAANKLLYQIKMAIEALGSATVGRTREGTVAALANTTSRASKPVFDKTISAHFEKSIRALAANQNQVYLDRHLKRFTDHSRRLAESAADADDSQHMDLQTRKLEIRQQRIHATRREHDVLHDAQEKGIREWERNQEIRLAQVYMKDTYKQRQAEQKQDAQLLATMRAREEVHSGIDEFERKVEAEFGITTGAGAPLQNPTTDTRTYDQFVEDIENQVPDGATMTAEAQGFMADMKARKAEARIAAGKRAKRRQQFLVSTAALHEDAAGRVRDAQLQAMLLKNTAEENALRARLATIGKYRDVLHANRKFREEQYAAQRLADADFNLARDAGNYAVATTQHERDLERQAQRAAESREQRGAVHRSRHVDWARHTVLKAVETALVIARQRELRRGPVPADGLREINAVFASRLEVEAVQAVVPRTMAEPRPAPAEGEEQAPLEVATPSSHPITASAGVVGSAEDRGFYEEAGASRSVFDVAQAGNEGKSDMVAETEALEADADPTPQQAQAQALLDAAAFELYIQQQGVWRAAEGATTSPPDILALAAQQAAEAAEAGGGKKGKGKGDFEPDPELAHTHVPVADGRPDGVVEYTLGAVARAVEAAANPPPAHPQLPPVPRFKIRAALLGAPFAGKTSQADLLAAKYSLRVLRPEPLLEEALAEAGFGDASQQGPVRAAGFASEEVEREWAAAAAAAGQEALALLQEGACVSDALYVRIIVLAIRAMGQAWQAPAGAPFNWLPAPRDDVQGWVLDGFPVTGAQAAALELALTGWAPPQPPQPSPATGIDAATGSAVAEDAATRRQRWATGLAPTLPPPADPLAVAAPYGVNAALHVVITPEAAARRALGRRRDPRTGEEYHIDRRPPPEDLVMKHLLEHVTDRHIMPYRLCDHSEAFWSNLPAVEAWYSQREEPQLRAVQAADPVPGTANGTATGPAAAARGVLDEEPLLERLSEQLDAAIAQDVPPAVLSFVAPAAEAEESKGEAEESKGEAEESKGEAEESKGEAEESTGEAVEDAAEGKEDVAAPDAESKDEAPAAAEGKEEVAGEAAESKAEAEPAAEPESKGDDAPPAAAPAEPEVPSCVSIIPAVKQQDRLLTPAARWNAAVDRFGSALEAELRALRIEEAGATQRLAVTRRRFLQFLRRPAPRKQQLVADFQNNFNAMPWDMRFQPAVKEELHMRTEEAALALWTVLAARRAGSEAELAALRGDSWLAHAQTSVARHLAACVQLEVDRFTAARRLLLDYAAAAAEVTPLRKEGEEEGAEGATTGLDGLVAEISGFLSPAEEEDDGGKKGKGKAKGKAKPKGKGKGKGKEEEEEEGEKVDPATITSAAVARGYEVAQASLAGVQVIIAEQNKQRELKAKAEAEAEAERLAAIAAAEEEAAAAAAGKKAKGKKGKAKGKGKKGEEEFELVVPEVTLPFTFIGGECLAAIRFEATQLTKRVANLEALARQATAALGDRAAHVFEHLQGCLETRYEREGAAVEAFVREARNAVEAETTLPLTLRLEGEYFVVDRSNRVLPVPPKPAPRVIEHVAGLHLRPSQLATLASALRSAASAAAGAGKPQSSYHGRWLPAPAFIDVCRRLAAASKLPEAWGQADASCYAQIAVAFDADRAGVVDWRRFVYAVSRSMPALKQGPTAQQLERMSKDFSSIDTEGSGRVAPSECNTVDLWFEQSGDLWTPAAFESAEGAESKGDDGEDSKDADDEGTQTLSASASANTVRNAFLVGWADNDKLLNYRRMLALWAVGNTVEESAAKGIATIASASEGGEPAATADDLAHWLTPRQQRLAAEVMAGLDQATLSASSLLAEAEDNTPAAELLNSLPTHVEVGSLLNIQ